MQVERPSDADSFLERAGPFLLEREAEHNLLLGIAGQLRSDLRRYGEDPYFAVALDGGRIAGVALRTPPHNLILSLVDDERAHEPLAADAQATFGRLPGVIGPSDAVAKFVRVWEERTGSTGRVAMRERTYRAVEARPPENVPGELRPYDKGDRELVLAWTRRCLMRRARIPTPGSSAARQIQTAGSSSGTTVSRSRSAASAAPPRTGSGLGRSLPRRSCAGAATGAR